MLSNTRVVLFEPHFSGNVGSIARLMQNYGLTDLVLVAPYANHLSDEAKRLSVHGEHILHNARVVPTLDAALTGCAYVLGTTGNVEGLFRRFIYGRPDEMLAKFVSPLRDNACAIVFGPEPSGLSAAEVMHCHGLIRILTDTDYPSLNLANSAAICFYELHRQWMNADGAATLPTHKVAQYEEQERMFHTLAGALGDVHFLWGTKGESLMHAVRHLISRAHPTPNEVRILMGLARQLRWVARNGPGTPPQEPEELPS